MDSKLKSEIQKHKKDFIRQMFARSSNKTLPKQFSQEIAKKANVHWDNTLHDKILSMAKTYMRESTEKRNIVKECFSEVLNESKKYKVGDIVIALDGPHKGQKHKVIHVFPDGKLNITPQTHINKYRHGAAGAMPNQVKLAESLNESWNSTEYKLKGLLDKGPKSTGLIITFSSSADKKKAKEFFLHSTDYGKNTLFIAYTDNKDKMISHTKSLIDIFKVRKINVLKIERYTRQGQIDIKLGRNVSESLYERCWDGYEPTPGKKPYEKGSCQKEEDLEEKFSSTGDSELDMLVKKAGMKKFVVHVHPMKRAISINGQKPMDYKSAKNKLKQMLH